MNRGQVAGKAMRKLVVILGIPVDNLSLAETLDYLEALIRDGRANRGHQVVTINVDFIVNALRDPDLLSILRDASLATADGMPLVWGSRLLGTPIQERVAGADLVPALAERAAQAGYSIYLLGAAPGVAAKAADILQQRFPNLKIVGVHSPPFNPNPEADPSTLEHIRAKRPDILMVAMGNPKQEKWIHRYGPQLNIPLMMGVGGSLDFIAGNTRRAPVWMQRGGIEWIWRLSQEPRRLWRRYVVGLGVFSIFFVRQWWAMRRGLAPSLLPSNTELFLVQDIVVMNIQGSLTIHQLPAFRQTARQALNQSARLIVHLLQAEFLDSAAIGALVELAKLARAAGGKLALAAVPKEIQQTFALLKLDTFFQIYPDIESALAAQADHTQAVNWRRQLVQN